MSALTTDPKILAFHKSSYVFDGLSIAYMLDEKYTERLVAGGVDGLVDLLRGNGRAGCLCGFAGAFDHLSAERQVAAGGGDLHGDTSLRDLLSD